MNFRWQTTTQHDVRCPCCFSIVNEQAAMVSFNVIFCRPCATTVAYNVLHGIASALHDAGAGPITSDFHGLTLYTPKALPRGHAHFNRRADA